MEPPFARRQDPPSASPRATPRVTYARPPSPHARPLSPPPPSRGAPHTKTSFASPREVTARSKVPPPGAWAASEAVSQGGHAGRQQLERARALLGASEHAAHRPLPEPMAPMVSTLPSPGLGLRNSKLLAASRTLGRPTSARAEPELLQKLLHFVRQELRLTDPRAEGYVNERLDVFRRAFGHFTSAFGAYAPLLVAVQQARAHPPFRGRPPPFMVFHRRTHTLRSSPRALLSHTLRACMRPAPAAWYRRTRTRCRRRSRARRAWTTWRVGSR